MHSMMPIRMSSEKWDVLCMGMVDKSFIYLGDKRTWIEIGQWVLLPKNMKMEIQQTQNTTILSSR